jgi:hypothetical protein
MGAKACPECGACEKSGWNEEESDYDGLDLPTESFDYERFLEDEFGEPKKKEGLSLMWKITTIVLLVVLGVLTGMRILFW